MTRTEGTQTPANVATKAAADYSTLELPGTLQFRGKPHRLLTIASADPARLSTLADLARRKGWLDYADGTDTATGTPALWMLKPST